MYCETAVCNHVLVYPTHPYNMFDLYNVLTSVFLTHIPYNVYVTSVLYTLPLLAY